MKYCCDVDIPIVRKAFAKRNWTKVEPHQDWNIYWTSVANARCLLAPDSHTRLSEKQRVNHFSTHYELTRKDLLARHMQRYQRQRGKSQQPAAIVPSTYVLPRDYNMFVDEYKRVGGLWIVKPCGKAQGIGIKLVDRPSQVKALINSWEREQPHVVCRYVHPPLLVGGRKFDLRLYVLVTFFQPLRAYLYRKGFCRFCQLHYRTKGLDNPFVHLTNVSVQRHGGRYNQSHGGKWSLSSLEMFVRGTRGSVSAARLRQDLKDLVVHSLTAVAPSMTSDWHCFEVYGYDVLLDEQLRPWLLEVNASPSLTSSTRADALLKQALVDDVLRLVAPSGKPPTSGHPEAGMGDFDQLLPETP
ncbi:polyglutamylase complex subunit TTLL1 [Rhipicephalus sanguineus]|uniref:polyglutamylase complex subunit TTLL1 n=1 Tax=Rhipicephalus sanguineus TaxID=34632 RepID=UPI0020C3A86D|nr:polyglutamylase complex subunit TTLL1 [Rhipicephalus sanguineus]